VLAHDLLDGLGGLIGVVERDGADIVVEDVGLDDAVEELSTDEAEFAIDGCSCTTDIIPAFGGIMRKSRVSVLEESDGNYIKLADTSRARTICIPSQWLTQRYGAKYHTAMLEKP
jgi:hypothetical protein